MDKEKATAILLQRLSEWESKPKTDGYQYEQSFIEVMQEACNQIYFNNAGL